MNYFEEYKKWLASDAIDAEDKAKLKEIENNENEIKDAFYQTLAFGTAGLRGVLGLGTNRMNKYVVRRATQGIANYISKHGEELKARGVVIGYDSRHFSSEFALETALTLCANGVKTYLFESLRPVPEISFSIRHLKCIAG
ncbi:MAG: phospho-sugar mutase, partial [Clostridia bacterium]|nr:phospho-sugar mutase [Clostridia bacterium]